MVVISRFALGWFLAIGLNAAQISDSMLQAIQSSNAVVIKSIIEQGADPDAVNAKGESGLMLAAAKGCVLCVQQFLSYPSVVVERVSAQGFSALMYAARQENIPIVRLLLGRGANSRSKGSAGLSALEIAKNFSTNSSLISLLENTVVQPPAQASQVVQQTAPPSPGPQELLAKFRTNLAGVYWHATRDCNPRSFEDLYLDVTSNEDGGYTMKVEGLSSFLRGRVRDHGQISFDVQFSNNEPIATFSYENVDGTFRGIGSVIRLTLVYERRDLRCRLEKPLEQVIERVIVP